MEDVELSQLKLKIESYINMISSKDVECKQLAIDLILEDSEVSNKLCKYISKKNLLYYKNSLFIGRVDFFTTVVEYTCQDELKTILLNL